jgi:hypothetical protein
MISDKRLRNWATAMEAQSTLKLAQFSRRRLIRSSRATTHITFTNEFQEYHVWILRELNLIILDVFHKRVQMDELLFRGNITDRSVERISEILRSTESWLTRLSRKSPQSVSGRKRS